jgi:hypothetical protein
MKQWNNLPPYIKRYSFRILLFMTAYAVILASGLVFARSGNDHSQVTLIVLALLTALPIIGVFWAVFRLLVETDDEYQRLLFAKQTLLATAFTLAIVTVWQFLEVYRVITEGPQWMGVIWFMMLGIAGPIARWKA